MSIKKDGLPLGQRLRFGNFYLEKYTRSLSKSEMRELRKEMRVRKDLRLDLSRGGLQYIRVSTVSGNWSVSWACTMSMFGVLDELEYSDGELTAESVVMMKNLASMLYMETTVLGDECLMAARLEAVSSYMSRVSSSSVPEDKGVLEEERVKAQTLSNLEGSEDE